jgi:hypothetical protein
VGRQIIDIERQARASAEKRGKGEELVVSEGEEAQDGPGEEGNAEATEGDVEAAAETE